jgi:hypothetical protein
MQAYYVYKVTLIWKTGRSKALPEQLCFVAVHFKILNTKHNLLYIRNQSAPRSKLFPPRL